MIKYSQDFKPKPDMPISRNRVMSYLNDLWYSCSGPGGKPFLKGETAVEGAMEAIEEMPRYTGEWISVSERLPEGYAQYLCYCEDGCCYVFWLDNEPWAEKTVEKEGIIAWQPLPEIYRPEGEKNCNRPLPEPYKGGDTE